MIRLPVPLVLLAGLIVAGCAPSSWPFDGSEPWAVNQPPPRQQRQQHPPSAAAFVGAGAVTVGRGDTVFALSRRHGVSVRAIIEANRLRPPFHLNVGQRIVLPRAREHVVKRGDTLGAVAGKYRIGLYELARANRLRSPYTIRVGQRLRISGIGAVDVASIRSKPVYRPPTRTATRTPSASAPRPPRSSGGFLWPVKGRVVSGFGPRAKGLFNDGINIAAPRGAAVRVSDNGVVAYAGGEIKAFGNLLLVRHSGGWITAYAHNERLMVRRGDVVKKGQVIARVGSTGTVSKPQLHFELRRGKRTVDPRKHLPKLKV